MPVITIEGALMNVEQKRKLAKVLTREAAEIMSVPEAAFIVLLKENSHENIGVGGTLLADRKK
ncbi:4-oxalocrotonate tautomerase DmpI [Anaeromusa acidaminophila]|uniref:4-oxalocrotonate tautomerase DmpI n=1 Tax=Anaeromusa acidaminophila TaxID=81464 RepID=UPI000375742B|nr:4-oxalocrotonate tautomerase DmpI [Anaeromusa acidaminophila]